MKIGIISLPLNTNYGGILQAYALQTVLKRMGHEAISIDKEPYTTKRNFLLRNIIYIVRFFRKCFMGKKIRVFHENYLRETTPIVRQNTNKFIEKYVQQLHIGDFSELKSNYTFDAYVVGSDQVWRPSYFAHIEDAFLEFAENQDVRRVAYAASFGIDTYEYSQTQEANCNRLIKKFNGVSVREESGIDICKRIWDGIDVQWVLDPTLLLSVDDYKMIFKSANTPKSKGSLLYYILDPSQSKTEIIEKISIKKSLKPFMVGSRADDIFAPLDERIQPPLEEWLRGFYDAEFVVTDSFHACVFSIIFHKPFFVIVNKQRGRSRMDSLLGMFHLEYLLINSSADIDFEHLGQIDWEFVEDVLSSKKKASMEFLVKSLG